MTRTFTVSDFKLQYTDADNGGGTSIGLDFKNILEFASQNRVTNPYSAAKADEKIRAHSRPGEERTIEDIHSAERDIQDLVEKIHRAQAAKSKRKSENRRQITVCFFQFYVI
jgi:hypothetical protein